MINATTYLQSSATQLPMFMVLGILVQFLTTPDQIRSDVSIMRTVIPPGMAIPLHRHADPEIFYLLEGSLEVFQDAHDQGVWKVFKAGEIVSIEGTVIHAIRNASNEPAICLVITKTELYSFLRELAHPYTRDEPIGNPTSNEMLELFATAKKYRYWMAPPEENAAIGLIIGGTPGLHEVNDEDC